MPTYDYGCVECDYEVEEILPIARRHEPLESPCPKCNGRIEQKIACPGFVYDNISGTTAKGHKKKPDEAFTDHLKQMKRNYPGANMNV